MRLENDEVVVDMPSEVRRFDRLIVDAGYWIGLGLRPELDHFAADIACGATAPYLCGRGVRAARSHPCRGDAFRFTERVPALRRLHNLAFGVTVELVNIDPPDGR